MSGIGIAQPDQLPEHKFRMDGVTVFDFPVPQSGPTTIITAGDSFTLRTEVGFDGNLDGMLAGQTFSVFHHVQNIETAATSILAGGGFAVPAVASDRAHITVVSGPFNTSDTGGGGQLEIPATFDAGTFRITTHVHADAAPVKPLVAALFDGTILMVTKP
ncbi:MAG TPA: hypothetical protein VEC96_11195 [Anaerolineae bacterium]|nr:hypothetical protein [Anaerolineae bacterium]